MLLTISTTMPQPPIWDTCCTRTHRGHRGVLGCAALLELPTRAEGFDELWYVRMDGNGGFVIEEWNDAL